MEGFAVFHLNPVCTRCQVFADMEEFDETQLPVLMERSANQGFLVSTQGPLDFKVSCSECDTLTTARKASRRVLVPVCNGCLCPA